jgi:hypothetical protein
MKNLSKLMLLALVAGGLLFSCNNDPDPVDPVHPGDPSVLSGTISENTTLDASVTYTISGSLLVDAGITLTIPAGTEIVSEVGTANYLAVLQGGTINVQGTASNPVIMRSNGTAGSWGGLLLCGNATTTEGVNATAEVGGLIYGGTEDADSSGSINYLIIRDAGAQINADSQFNGLTLYAVGSGTSINNVAIINGTDDGVEFFGGTVNATNMYFENNEDDSVDWTEGWNGTLTNAYVVNTIANFSTAIEADGVNNNPTLVNFTAISANGGTAIQIKNDSGATINGLTLTGFGTSFDFRDNAPASNLQVDGADADTATDATFTSSSTNASLFAWATSAAVGSQLPSNISSDLTLDASVQYTITGPVLVNSGATLTIPAGTEIVSASGTANYLAVLQGGAIDIQGTANNPVVMRSSDGNAWGGLLLCGNATTTEGVNAIAEVGGLVYGGTADNDSSGNIDYLILRNTGAQINADSQFNGLSLYAVGSGTTIDNVAVIEGADDGVEFFGGTVSVTNFYAENIEDDAVDWTEGWNGTLTNAYVAINIADFSTAIEADGVNNNPTLVNFTAISSTGGKAIQIKNDSGATINGLTLNGFDDYLDFRDNAPASNLQVDGADVDTATDAVYASSSTNASQFAWATADADPTQAALPANIASDITLDPTIQYTITGPVLVSNGATLTIPAGTEIISDSGTANYLAVLQGASIDIQGTSADPVEMKSVDGNAWGGLLICGNATTTEGVNAIAEVGGLIYGGTNDTESSGNIDYLILRNTGAQINADSQFNGLTLYAVGSGTTIDNVAVIGGADDGVEFFGGTVSVTNFYAENLEDDSVDWTEGWNGTLTNTFVKLTIANFSTAIEADGVNNNPTIANFHAVSTTGGKAVQVKNASGGTMTNVTLTGFGTQFDFRDNAPASNLQVNGADADENATYNTSTVVEADFSWINN